MVQTIGTVRVDGEVVTVRQRALLAALALYRDRGATVDVLVDAIWGEHSPASARKSVHNQIGRLRRAFGADLIITHGDYYRLNARTDVDRIHDVARALSRRPGDVIASSDATAIIDVLAAWRGEPFADIPDDPTATGQRARLEHLQSRFVEVLALHRLTGSRQDRERAIGDLSARISTHPLHERAWELLAATQHVSGQRTEALGTFERFSALLDDLLGAAPSNNFRRLQTTIAAERPFDPVAFFTTGNDLSPLLLESA